MCDEEMTGTGPVYGPTARAREQAAREQAQRQPKPITSANGHVPAPTTYISEKYKPQDTD